MGEASRAVLNGFTLGVDVKVWRYPQRFMDEKRGRATWDKIQGYLCGQTEGDNDRCIQGSARNTVSPVSVIQRDPRLNSPYVSPIII